MSEGGAISGDAMRTRYNSVRKSYCTEGEEKHEPKRSHGLRDHFTFDVDRFPTRALTELWGQQSASYFLLSDKQCPIHWTELSRTEWKAAHLTQKYPSSIL